MAVPAVYLAIKGSAVRPHEDKRSTLKVPAWMPRTHHPLLHASSPITLLFWGHATSIFPAASPWGAQTSEAAVKALFVWEVGPPHTRGSVEADSSFDSVQAVPNAELEFTGQTCFLNHRKASPPHQFSTLCQKLY